MEYGGFRYLATVDLNLGQRSSRQLINVWRFAFRLSDRHVHAMC